MLVSEIEKNPENARSTANATNSVDNGIASTDSVVR
jgi:hypothetical protein